MKIPAHWKEGNKRGTTEKDCPWCGNKFLDYENFWGPGCTRVECAKRCGYGATLMFGELTTEEVVRYLMKKRPI